MRYLIYYFYSGGVMKRIIKEIKKIDKFYIKLVSFNLVTFLITIIKIIPKLLLEREKRQ